MDKELRLLFSFVSQKMITIMNSLLISYYINNSHFPLGYQMVVSFVSLICLLNVLLCSHYMIEYLFSLTLFRCPFEDCQRHIDNVYYSHTLNMILFVIYFMLNVYHTFNLG